MRRAQPPGVCTVELKLRLTQARQATGNSPCQQRRQQQQQQHLLALALQGAALACDAVQLLFGLPHSFLCSCQLALQGRLLSLHLLPRLRGGGGGRRHGAPYVTVLGASATQYLHEIRCIATGLGAWQAAHCIWYLVSSQRRQLTTYTPKANCTPAQDLAWDMETRATHACCWACASMHARMDTRIGAQPGSHYGHGPCKRPHTGRASTATALQRGKRICRMGRVRRTDACTHAHAQA